MEQLVQVTLGGAIAQVRGNYLRVLWGARGRLGGGDFKGSLARNLGLVFQNREPTFCPSSSRSQPIKRRKGPESDGNQKGPRLVRTQSAYSAGMELGFQSLGLPRFHGAGSWHLLSKAEVSNSPWDPNLRWIPLERWSGPACVVLPNLALPFAPWDHGATGLWSPDSHTWAG